MSHEANFVRCCLLSNPYGASIFCVYKRLQQNCISEGDGFSVFACSVCVKVYFCIQICWCSLCFLLWVCSPAEADCVEEAAVAWGTWVTAARLGHTALSKLRAVRLHRFVCLFTRERKVIWRNRDCVVLRLMNPLSFILSSPRKQWSLSARVHRPCALRNLGPAVWQTDAGSLIIVAGEDSSTDKCQMQNE